MTRAGVTGITARRIATAVHTGQRIGKKTMAQYVERSSITDALLNNTSLEGYDLEEAVNAICAIPAADVRPVVHGHWVYEEPNGANSFKGAYWCDQCHQPESYRKNFCPNCGADMREES